MATAIIIDDEYYSIEGLKIELELLGGVDIIATYENCSELLNDIEILKPDIIFLDIEMPEMNGLILFNKILDKSPTTKIVFVTAYNDFAVEAFELNAADYLIKPVQTERLKKTLERLSISNSYQIRNNSIKIECFGRLSLILNGEYKTIHWRTKKSLELLCYLICHKNRFIAKEKIGDLLWPDASPEKIKSNFHLTYYHLKKTFEDLNIPVPFESKRGSIRLNVDQFELETVIFEYNLSQLEIINPSNILLAEETLAMYRGHIFEEHYFSWSSELQSKYDISYIILLKKIITYYKNISSEKYIHYKKIMVAKCE